MRKNFKAIFVILLLGFIAFTTSFGQKYGHLNAGNLLEKLPEVHKADTMLIQYRDSMIQVGKERARVLDEKVTAFLEKRNAGELTPLEEQKQAAALQEEEQALNQYQDEVLKMVQKKRQEFLGPILKRVNEAVQAVGKENNYTMIFDTSIPNTVLYVEESDDVLALVLKKLGIE